MTIHNFAEGDMIEIVGHPELDTGAIRRINVNKVGELFVFCNNGQIMLDGEFTEAVNSGFVTITKC